VTTALLQRYLIDETQLKHKLIREYLTSGINEIDAAVGGLPRGAITEIFGPASSGRTTFLNAFLAGATRRGEFCALVDTGNCFDPHSAAAMRTDLTKLLWVRCQDAGQAMKCADLLIHSGGWGGVALDMGDVPVAVARRIPVSYWYRFRRAIEPTPTVFVVLQREPYARSCASLALEFRPGQPVWSGNHPDFQILRATRLHAKAKKPVQTQTRFEARAVAG
jgi:hypothetical protein